MFFFVWTQLTNVTDGQTDRQTPHDDIGRACIASRDKNYKIIPLIPTLKLHSNTVISKVAVDWWAVKFGTARRDLGGLEPAQSPPRSARCTKCNSPPINGQCTNFISFDVAL